MRGKATNSETGEVKPGITPAYAGKSQTQWLLACLHRDHPRLCGEKLQTQLQCNYLLGSPPPMRGKVAICGRLATAAGITPAYAGKRTASIRNFKLL